MGQEAFICKVLKEIETLRADAFVYAHRAGNTTALHTWWEVSVSDFGLYAADQRFKQLCSVWHEMASSMGIRLVFVCGWKPTERHLLELADVDNLVLNV